MFPISFDTVSFAHLKTS
uniref:Uncharacterized protein n=1 Tax=Arundo donax TaxID=35708 RepID=A0A0A8YQV7_ARUDO